MKMYFYILNSAKNQRSDKYIQIQNRLINQMQRDLRSMNLRLEVALNDITGKSGRNIIEAILKGERNPANLAMLAEPGVKKSKAEIALSLEGNWNEAYLFTLNQHYREYIQNLQMIQECEKEIDTQYKIHLENSDIEKESIPRHKKVRKKNKNKPKKKHYNFDFWGKSKTRKNKKQLY